jgi:carbonic anhydrase/acetyltransferase-like protein (isoleucine patch superfamily)
MPTPESSPVENPFTALQNLLHEIGKLCFDPRLLQRQADFDKFKRDDLPVMPGAQITLGAALGPDNEMQISHIGNVSQIRRNAIIKAGAQIGDYVFVGNAAVVSSGAQVENYAWVSHGAHVGARSRVEAGARLQESSSTGQNCIVTEGTFVGVDQSLPDHSILSPN